MFPVKHSHNAAPEADSFSARFRARFKRDSKTGCLLWQGACDPKGYGLVRKPSGVLERVHRLAFKLWVRKLLPGEWVRHNALCTHENRHACGEPTHLEAYTPGAAEEIQMMEGLDKLKRIR